MIPAVLVTGFLGSGKTTFILNGLAPQLGGRRFAVLVNDLGEVNFDGRMLARAGLHVVEVEGGCICCSAGGRLLDALGKIRDTIRPDLLIVEGSGLADPFPLIESLELLDFALQGVVCTIGAGNVEQTLARSLARSQLAAAHCVVLTHADRIGDVHTRQAIDAIARVRAVPVFAGCEGEVDSGLWQLLSGAPVAAREHVPARFAPRIAQHTIHPQGIFRKRDLERYLAGLPPSVLRIKALVQCIECPLPLALNWAQGTVTWYAIEEPDHPFVVAISESDPREALSSLPATLPASLAGVDDAAMLPLGDFDTREGVAYIDGRPCAEIDAIEALVRLLGRDREGTWIVHRALARAPEWMRHAGKLLPLPEFAFATLRRLSRSLSAGTVQQALCWDIPSAVTDWLAGALPGLDVLHVGEAYRLPRAKVSIAARDALRRRALEHHVAAALG